MDKISVAKKEQPRLIKRTLLMQNKYFANLHSEQQEILNSDLINMPNVRGRQ